ncbi:MAG: exodeoxyribonuclease V subunit gamma [Balneolaceae bacterium]|nr:exodeoxyribonuclease V subunit gamma [Balneolaceae bacterium]
MLRIFTSHKLERLADRLVEERGERLPADPLDPERYVVQNHGVARWLTLRLGAAEGIAANLSFEFPAERTWATARILYPGLPRVLPSDKGPMAWEIFRVLQSEDRDILRPLQSYVEAGGEEGRELRRWKLARKIADVFDQYLVYRPDWMLAWEEGERVTGHRDEAWQAWLWQAMVGHWRERYGDHPWLHRARLHRHLEEAVTGGNLREGDLPGGISIFGVTSMPPPVARLLVRCAGITDVTFYQCLTADQGSGEPLASSWGASGLAFYEELMRLAGKHRPGAEVRSLDSGAAAEEEQYAYGEHNLLGALQRSLRGQPPAAPEEEEAQWDNTLQVHSCHSALREVQVLHDRILEMLDANPGLGPGDILVVNPEMERYAPLIDSVFGVTEEHLPRIPYRVVDGRSSTAPVEQALLALLDLASSRFKASDVLDFLELDPVRGKLDLSDDELDRIERWTDDNRVRWGIDETFKRELDLPASPGNTWRAGLSRMLLGYAMEPSEDELFEGMVPYGKVSGTEEAVMMGELSRWLSRLFELHRFVSSSHSLDEWAKRLRGELHRFLDSSDPHTRDWFRVAGVLDRLTEQGDVSGFDRPVAFEPVADWLGGELQTASFGGNPTGGVTFSSMISLRNIPYRVICLTGLSDGAYPRAQPSPAFDLTRSEPRAGDRSRLEEDRQVMLEALNSARQNPLHQLCGTEQPPGGRFPALRGGERAAGSCG